MFTALLLAVMAKRGEVEIDDPVDRHLPGDFHLPPLSRILLKCVFDPPRLRRDKLRAHREPVRGP